MTNIEKKLIINLEDFVLEKPLRKELNKIIDLIINESEENNFLLYGFTINILYKEEYQKLKENNFELYKKFVRDKIYNYLSWIEEIPLISFCYLAPEKNKNNMIHLHGIIGLKSILGFNDSIEKNLLEYFIAQSGYSEFDIKIDKLNTWTDKKKWFLYCTKTIGWGWDIYPPLKNKNFDDLNYQEKKKAFQSTITHHFYQYDNIIEESYTTFTEFIENHGYCAYGYDNQEINQEINGLVIKRGFTAQIITGSYINKYANIGSFPEKEKNYNEYTLVNLVNFFLIYNNNYINETGIYEKIENSLFSTNLKYQKENLTNKLEEIFFSVRNHFWIQLKNIDFYTLKIKYFQKFEELIDKSNHPFLNWVDNDLSLVEFKDGIYLTNYDKFLPKSFLIKNNINLEKTKKMAIKYYNKTYKHLTKPNMYLELLKNSLGDEKILINFCEKLGYLLAIEIKPKRNKETMYIHGESLTGKSYFFKSFLKKIFPNHTGEITKSNVFKLESLLGKKIAILDEFEHQKITMDLILKLLEGEEITIDRKFKKAKNLNLIKFVIISNNKMKIKDKMIENAINSRIEYFEFINKFLPNSNEEKLEEIIKKLNNEEANMFIYCIKLFFKKYIYHTKKKPNYERQKFIKYFFDSNSIKIKSAKKETKPEIEEKTK